MLSVCQVWGEKPYRPCVVLKKNGKSELHASSTEFPKHKVFFKSSSPYSDRRHKNKVPPPGDRRHKYQISSRRERDLKDLLVLSERRRERDVKDLLALSERRRERDLKDLLALSERRRERDLKDLLALSECRRERDHKTSLREQIEASRKPSVHPGEEEM